MANDHMYHEQCSVPSHGRNGCPHRACQQNVDPFDTAREFLEPRAPHTFIRVSENGNSAVMVLIGLAEDQKVPDWLLGKYISFPSFGQIDLGTFERMQRHLRLNAMVPLAISAGEISCSSCQLLIQTIISLYANFSVEPFALDRISLGSPVAHLKQCSCSAFSPNLRLDKQEGTSSFTLRVNGLITKCEARFDSPGITCAGESQAMAIYVREQGILAKRFYCPYHAHQARNHGVCICQKLSVSSQLSDSLQVCAKNDLYHTKCALQCPHLLCTTRCDRGAYRIGYDTWGVAKKLAWDTPKRNGHIVVVAHSRSETNKFMASRETHMILCTECQTLVQYWIGYDEEILAKEQCPCVKECLVSSVVILPHAETNKVFTEVFQNRLFTPGPLAPSNSTATVFGDTLPSLVVDESNVVKTGTQRSENVRRRPPLGGRLLSAAVLYCLLVSAACHNMTTCDCSASQLLGVVELVHFDAIVGFSSTVTDATVAYALIETRETSRTFEGFPCKLGKG